MRRRRPGGSGSGALLLAVALSLALLLAPAACDDGSSSSSSGSGTGGAAAAAAAPSPPPPLPSQRSKHHAAPADDECLPNCALCGERRDRDPPLVCRACVPGHSMARDQRSCCPCPVHRYSPGGFENDCKPCPAGYSTAGTGSATCDVCSKGYGGAPSSATGLLHCAPCVSGVSFSYGNTTAPCLPCSQCPFTTCKYGSCFTPRPPRPKPSCGAVRIDAALMQADYDAAVASSTGAALNLVDYCTIRNVPGGDVANVWLTYSSTPADQIEPNGDVYTAKPSGSAYVKVAFTVTLSASSSVSCVASKATARIFMWVLPP